MKALGFYGLPSTHLNHKPWRLKTLPRESVRGVIRGAATREQLLYPSPAKAVQRKIRQRLVAAYMRRFGVDDFSKKFNVPKMPSRQRGNWLPGGYAYFRERIYSDT